MTQLDDNLAAGRVSLSQEELMRLNKVSEPAETYPYRFLRLHGWRDPNPEQG
jgi:hypothetical protein